MKLEHLKTMLQKQMEISKTHLEIAYVFGVGEQIEKCVDEIIKQGNRLHSLSGKLNDHPFIVVDGILLPTALPNEINGHFNSTDIQRWEHSSIVMWSDVHWIEITTDLPTRFPAQDANPTLSLIEALDELSTPSAMVEECNPIHLGTIKKSSLDFKVKFTVEPDNIQSTLVERGTLYGHFTQRSEICQLLKEICFEQPTWTTLAPYQRQAIEVILDKISRILNGNPDYADSWVDIAGYSQLVVNELNKQYEVANSD